MGKRKISESDGLAALRLWGRGNLEPDVIALSVRFTLQRLADRAPGSSVEVRVPPYGAVQVVAGPSHTRGTPPAVVEMAPDVWLMMATGRVAFAEAMSGGQLSASGVRSNLSEFLPLVELT